MLKIEQISAGMILRSWHDTGIHGMECIFYKVQRVAKVKVFVRCENGKEGWMYPGSFDRIVDPTTIDYIKWA